MEMLAPWETVLNLEEKVHPNLVRIFYSNIELSTNRLDQIVTYVGGIPIEFIMEDLNSILETDHMGLELYTSRKEIQFSRFSHVDAVMNICRRRDLSDDICSLPFRSQLLVCWTIFSEGVRLTLGILFFVTCCLHCSEQQTSSL